MPKQGSFDFDPDGQIPVTEVIMKKGDFEMHATILGNPDQIQQWLQDGVEIIFLQTSMQKEG